MSPPGPGGLGIKTVDFPASLTWRLLFLPFRWASFAEGTKKLLKLRRTVKRMKTVGTGSRKTSDLPPHPTPIMGPSGSPVFLIFVSSIFGRKNLLQIFRRPHDAVLVLVLSSPGANLRQSLRPGHLTGTTTTSFSSWTHNFGKPAAEPGDIYGCNMRGQPSGENCYLKVFL